MPIKWKSMVAMYSNIKITIKTDENHVSTLLAWCQSVQNDTGNSMVFDKKIRCSLLDRSRINVSPHKYGNFW